jgi:hypothetical protein
MTCVMANASLSLLDPTPALFYPHQQPLSSLQAAFYKSRKPTGGADCKCLDDNLLTRSASTRPQLQRQHRPASRLPGDAYRDSVAQQAIHQSAYHFLLEILERSAQVCVAPTQLLASLFCASVLRHNSPSKSSKMPRCQLSQYLVVPHPVHSV